MSNGKSFTAVESGFGESLGHDGKSISYKKLLDFSGKSSKYIVSRLP